MQVCFSNRYVQCVIVMFVMLSSQTAIIPYQLFTWNNLTSPGGHCTLTIDALQDHEIEEEISRAEIGTYLNDQNLDGSPDSDGEEGSPTSWYL